MASNDSIEALFDQDFLKQLEVLSLHARQLVHGAQRAERKADKRGVSAEFAEYRAYVPGDDPRHIDWNAYARWRHLVLKIFVEEHDLPVYLMLDCSRSMDWGEPIKFNYARQVIAGLHYIGLSNQDRVGIVPLGNNKAKSANRGIPATRGKGRYWRICQILAGYKTQDGSLLLDDEVKRWLLTKPRRGMVIWVTDLWGATPKDALNALDRLRYSRNEVGVIQIMDRQERFAGELGEYQVRCVESNKKINVLVDQRVQKEYQRRFDAYQEEIQRYCRKGRMPLIQVDTQTPVTELLLKALQIKGFVT